LKLCCGGAAAIDGRAWTQDIAEELTLVLWALTTLDVEMSPPRMPDSALAGLVELASVVAKPTHQVLAALCMKRLGYLSSYNGFGQYSTST